MTVFRQLSTGGVRDVGVKLVRSLLRDRRLVPGVGAAELELMRRCARVGGRDAVRRFAEPLEVEGEREGGNEF